MNKKALGQMVAAKAAKNPAFGKMLDGLKHNSPARLKAASRKVKKRK